MRIAGEDMMRRRKALAEHPFGTLKCRAGYRHFLVRGFAKVRGEWSLMALCYNFSRVLRILGFDRWLAVLAMRTRDPSDMLFFVFVGMSRQFSRLAPAICRAFQAMARRRYASVS
jgi:Transposase DDE domain